MNEHIKAALEATGYENDKYVLWVFTRLYNAALEEAAKVCEQNNEVYQSGGTGGWKLEPKYDMASLQGKTYAENIRNLKENE